jgi:hypothetical protein
LDLDFLRRGRSVGCELEFYFSFSGVAASGWRDEFVWAGMFIFVPVKMAGASPSKFRCAGRLKTI